ncbi:hypothetical protein DL767_003788 [Monosporascus sp. MG133]|nr:hypothetical protein DL767_003788 [Monosporascus sp. MG133]
MNDPENLEALKASAGERHARDKANNPHLPGNAVPGYSAAQKTDSALGHYTAGIATNMDTNPPDPQRVNKTVPGRHIPLDAEPALAEAIRRDAETANNPAAADHFAKAAEQLDAAYHQDKEWLAKHPEKDQGSRE